MTTTSAAANLGHPAEKEKEKPAEKTMEKRRALGRGLESLLPGPRVVKAAAGQPAAVPVEVPHTADHGSARPGLRPGPNQAGTSPGTRAGVPAPHETALHESTVQPPTEEHEPPITIQAVVEDAVDEAAAELGSARPGLRPGPTQGDETITIFAQAESRIPGNLVTNLAIADIDKNPYQTRYIQDDERLEELAESIRANGVVQPIMVRPAEEDGRYILILGERRLTASRLAGKETIPAIVRKVSLQQAAEMTIIENLQREDLSALEQAEAFRVLSKEFQLTQQQIGERVGLSRESVSNYMRLLKLPPMVMEQLAQKEFGFSEARELLKLEDPDLIQKTAAYIVKKHMTLEQVETLVMRMMGLLDPVPGMPGQAAKKSGARWVDPNVRAAQLEMERMLGVRVRIRDRKGKGKIVIEYHTVDDYERVVGMLRGKK